MFPNFARELQLLGISDVERANALDVSTKTIERYRAAHLPEPLMKLLRAPQLLRALAQDADAMTKSADINVGITS
ncbi:MAG: hypothetical protein IPP13_22345 [Kouleothrix sp.]|nr:hypothetical protein [Kouleothrix sp.]